MPLFASNFTSNSLSGTVRVSGGAANINFGIAPFALEGNKSFVVKLRRGSIVGDVIGTSNPITINDFSQVISLTANISTVAEGNIVSISLVTANVPNNANVFYSVLPVTANVTASDFLGANAGMATIINNQATFAFYANTDAGYVDETNETFKVQLRTGNTSGNIVYTTANVVVTDFYKLFNVFGLVESSSSVAEGNPVTFTVTAHNVPTGTVLYYDTVGNLTSFSANTGSFIMNGVSNTISITGTNVASNTITDYRLRVRKDSLTGTILATSNTINISNATVQYLTVSGVSGNVLTANGYTVVVFPTSNTITFSSLGNSPARNTVEYTVIAGGGCGRNYGGGGAGGFRTGNIVLAATDTYTITVGAGGVVAGADNSPGSRGGESTFKNSSNTINISAMGGGSYEFTLGVGMGGSGAGGGYGTAYGVPMQTGAAGFNYPGPAQQGYPGGNYVDSKGGGGGGAGGAGTNPNPAGTPIGKDAGTGGIGAVVPYSPDFFGTTGPSPGRWFAGGGGGASNNGGPYGGDGGAGGGGHGRLPGGGGITNTGGGGGAYYPGGSGIVIIRYQSAP